ncbi:MAG: hypothetical protein AB3N15_07885 [Paracoccaceae bacterium]
MKQIAFLTLVLALSALPRASQAAECYADYKAKQDAPLKLHYGVMQVSGPCSAAQAQTELSQRLSANGWTLLNVISVFGPDGLQQRKADAGPYYLSF